MARGQQKMRRRPSKGAVAGRLIGAFVLGTAVMGGGLYLFEHTQNTADRGSAKLAGKVVPPTTGPVAAPAGAVPEPTAPLDATTPAKTAAGVPDATAAAVPTGGTAASTRGKPLPHAPFGESEEVFETGARVYVAHCASCHGQPGRAGSAGGQFWGAGSAAVAAEPAGLLFQQTANGVPPGMKGYRGELHETEMWDVALLLRNAGQDLPDPVMRILRSHPAH